MKSVISHSAAWGIAICALLLVANVSATPLSYTMEQVGLTDGIHTGPGYYAKHKSNIELINDAGYLAGSSLRSPIGYDDSGQSAWVYDGVNTNIIGYVTGEHVSADGELYSSVFKMNASGQVLGTSKRYGYGDIITCYPDPDWEPPPYNPYEPEPWHPLICETTQGALNFGNTSWVYDGTDTKVVGLTDAEHTRDSDGYRYGGASFLNNQGRVAGSAARYGTGLVTIYDPQTGEQSQVPGDVTLGLSAWYYNGTSTQKIGLVSYEYERKTDGYKSSSVVGLSDTGIAVGESAYYGSGSDYLGRTAWHYNGTNVSPIGMQDAEHTHALLGYQDNDAFRINRAGHTIGRATRFEPAGNGNLGFTTWIQDGGTTKKIGLTDAEHTRATDGNRSSSVIRYWVDSYVRKNSIGDKQDTYMLNEAGQVVGSSSRYAASGASTGNSTWFYDGTATRNISLTDAEHIRDTDGRHASYPKIMTDSGKVGGNANRYGAGGTDLGESIWVFSGTSTHVASLTDAEHTRVTDGYRDGDLYFLRDSGHAAGRSARYAESDGYYMGQSVWLFDGTETVRIGLLDEKHTLGVDTAYYRTGHQGSVVTFMNEAGQAGGHSFFWDDNGRELGRTPWFFDGEVTISLGGLSENSWGASRSEVEWISDDGVVIGTYNFYDENDDAIESAFIYTAEGGLRDLGLAVDETYDEWNWESSLGYNSNQIEIIDITPDGKVYGNGNLAGSVGGATSRMGFIMTPNIVPGTLPVSIDVDPFGAANEVRPSSNNLIALAVMGSNTATGDSEDFDATQVDPASLKLGIGEAQNVAIPWVYDFDGDTNIDVAFGFRTQDTGIVCGDTEVTLVGETLAGEPFTATDTISTSDCVDAGCHP